MNNEVYQGSNMIPTTTELTDEQYDTLKNQIIPRREKYLRKLTIHDLEASLWLMGELDHIKSLLKFNENLRNPLAT
jgi:hypothetical protein